MGDDTGSGTGDFMATMHNLIERIEQRQAQSRGIDDLGDEIVEMLRTSLGNEAVFHARLGYYMCWPHALEPTVRRKLELILNRGERAIGIDEYSAPADAR